MPFSGNSRPVLSISKKNYIYGHQTILFVTLKPKVARGLITVDRQICIGCSHPAQVCIQLGLTTTTQQVIYLNLQPFLVPVFQPGQTIRDK